jgi:hypothetical protein
MGCKGYAQEIPELIHSESLLLLWRIDPAQDNARVQGRFKRRSFARVRAAQIYGIYTQNPRRRFFVGTQIRHLALEFSPNFLIVERYLLLGFVLVIDVQSSRRLNLFLQTGFRSVSASSTSRKQGKITFPDTIDRHDPIANRFLSVAQHIAFSVSERSLGLIRFVSIRSIF